MFISQVPINHCSVGVTHPSGASIHSFGYTYRVTFDRVVVVVVVVVQVRVAFEEFSGHASQMLSRLEEMQDTVSRKDFPQDLEGARRMIEEHATLKKKVIKAPIEELDTEGQR